MRLSPNVVRNSLILGSRQTPAILRGIETGGKPALGDYNDEAM
jgi:hypothetical protein